jgi:membrane-associated phospholipid phosphatase
MGATLVYAGEHYAVDVIAGVVLAVAAWRVADRIAPAYPRRAPAETRAAGVPGSTGTDLETAAAIGGRRVQD